MNKQRVIPTFVAALILIFAAAFLVLGIQSTTAFAAETDQPTEEVVLYSEQSVPVPQEITQEDYDKMEDQYNIHPDGTPVIESKTVETETVVTKSDTKIKTTNKTTTEWVVRDTNPAAPSTGEIAITAPDRNEANTTSTSNLTPVLLALAVPAVAIATPVLVAAAPVIMAATPVILAVAVPTVIAIALTSNSSSANASTSSSPTAQRMSLNNTGDSQFA